MELESVLNLKHTKLGFNLSVEDNTANINAMFGGITQYMVPPKVELGLSFYIDQSSTLIYKADIFSDLDTKMGVFAQVVEGLITSKNITNSYKSLIVHYVMILRDHKLFLENLHKCFLQQQDKEFTEAFEKKIAE